MTPYYFGPKDQQIFASLHLPESGNPARHGVLFCSPFGQEAIRTHRFFRVLADRLTRVGVAVMRFEYFGTGDSAGNDDETDLLRWRDDALLAHAELKRHTGLEDIRWFGARLGANVALQAVQHGGLKPARMTLWDPVPHGLDYVEMLRVEHLKRIKESFRRPDSPWADWQQTLPGHPMHEASGFPMSDTMRNQMLAIRLELDEAGGSEKYVIVRDPADPILQTWATRACRLPNVSVLDLAATFSWTEHEALNGTVVPGDALRCLLGTLGE